MAGLDDVAWPVTTGRLVLRRTRPDDADATFAYRSLDEVGRWITRLATDPVAWASRWVSEEWISMQLVIELDGVVIGDLMLRVLDGWGQAEVSEQTVGVEAELGWCLDPAYGGKGYATEAVRGLIDVCFGQLGLRRLVASCFAANVASSALMERLGMRREGYHVQDSLHRSGEWLDGMTYALLASEWAARDGSTPGGGLAPEPLTAPGGGGG